MALSFEEKTSDVPLEKQGFRPFNPAVPNVIEKRYQEVSASSLYFFKRNQRLSNKLRLAVDDCIGEISKIQPHQVLSNMQLTIQPDLNSDEKAIICSGNQQNRLVAFRSGSDQSDADGPLELVWYRDGPEAKESSPVIQYLPYILLALFLAALYGFLLSTFVLHDFKIRAQAEGVITLRAFTVDSHHDRVNEYYKLPREDIDGSVEFPYKGD